MSLALICLAAIATDGDTLRCANLHSGTPKLRLARVDAPEMPGHCRRGRDCAPGDPYAAKAFLQALVKGRNVPCRRVDANPAKKGFQRLDPWKRPVVRCTVNGVDLSEAILAAGHGRVWP